MKQNNDSRGLLGSDSAVRIHCTPVTQLPCITEGVEHLSDAGYTVVFTNPLLASADQNHGYWLTRPEEWEEARGCTETTIRDLVLALQRFDMGYITDVVHHLYLCEATGDSLWLQHLAQSRFLDVTELRRVLVEQPNVFMGFYARLFAFLGSLPIRATARLDSYGCLADPHGFGRMFKARLPDRTLIGETTLRVGEDLPVGWEGATGQDANRDTKGVLVNEQGHRALVKFYRQFTDDGRSNHHRMDWADILQGGREHQVRTFDPEIDALYQLARRIDGRTTRSELVGILLADNNDALPANLAGNEDFLVELRLTRHALHTQGWITAVHRFYANPAFLEGCFADPERPHVSIPDFHGRNIWRAHRYPHGLVTLANHDFLLQEDSAAWLVAASHLPKEVMELFRQLRCIAHQQDENVHPMDEAMIYWTVLASPTLNVERQERHVQKALRQAALRSHWQWDDRGWTPNLRYESQVKAFLKRLLNPLGPYWEHLNAFLEKLEPLARQIALAQALAVLTMPGVSETYQGAWSWAFGLEDPDNRFEADFAGLQQLLGQFNGKDAKPTIAPIRLLQPTADTTKFYCGLVVRRLKKKFATAFQGQYRPVYDVPAGVCAYMRGDGMNDSDLIEVRFAIDPFTNQWPAPRQGWVNKLSCLEQLGLKVGLYVRESVA